MTGDLTWNAPRFWLYIITGPISSRAPLLSTWERGCKNQKLCHFLHSCRPYFPLTFSLSISFGNFSLFSKVSIKFQLLVTTSDSLVATTFVTILEPFPGDSPQPTTSKYEHKNWITDQCHKGVPCGTWVYNDTGWGFTPGIIAWQLHITRKRHDYIWQYVEQIQI